MQQIQDKLSSVLRERYILNAPVRGNELIAARKEASSIDNFIFTESSLFDSNFVPIQMSFEISTCVFPKN